MTQVGVLTSTMFNIGNLFIDLGAKEALDDATDEDINIVRAHDFPSYNDSLSGILKTLSRPFWRLFGDQVPQEWLDRFYYNYVHPTDRFNLVKALDTDYFVFPGCVMTVYFFRQFMPVMRKMTDNNVKIIFAGVGSNSYTEYEKNYLKKCLKEITPYGLISRDMKAYENYGYLAEHSYQGIDCAYYVDKLGLDEAKLDLPPYAVLTFDKYKSSQVENYVKDSIPDELSIITTSHTPLADRRSFRNRPPSDDDFVSTSPYDYLLLYANAEEVHADRVHACVPALSYKNKSRLYKEELRAGIFDDVTNNDITASLCKPKDLKSQKQNQIKFLSELIE